MLVSTIKGSCFSSFIFVLDFLPPVLITVLILGVILKITVVTALDHACANIKSPIYFPPEEVNQ